MFNPAAPCTHTEKRFPKAWTLLCSTVAFYYVLASFLWERLTCDPQIRPLGGVLRSPLWNIQVSSLKLALTVTTHIVDKEEVVLFFLKQKLFWKLHGSVPIYSPLKSSCLTYRKTDSTSCNAGFLLPLLCSDLVWSPISSQKPSCLTDFEESRVQFSTENWSQWPNQIIKPRISSLKTSCKI